jgi:hypothetical protein
MDDRPHRRRYGRPHPSSPPPRRGVPPWGHAARSPRHGRPAAYRFPYVLAFGPTGLEVRTLINGKLLRVLPAAGLDLGTSRAEIYVSCAAGKGPTHDLYRVAMQ